MEFDLKLDLSPVLKMEENFPLVINKAFRAMAEDVATEATKNIDSGAVGLKRRSGKLSNSIKVLRYVQPSTNGVGSALVGSPLVYAAIHEYGGIIRPIKGKYLTFQIEGKWVRVTQVTIPARPYLKPATETTTSKFTDYLNVSLEELTALL